MTKDEILTRAAEAMHESYAPGAPRDSRWIARSVAMYRRRFATGLAAVEDDIRRDERNRITNWLRVVALRPDITGTATAVVLKAIAAELDRRPIEECQ